jgi:hypothetical protein
MLAIIFEAAIRSSVLIVAIWIGLKALRVSNPHILMSTWRLVLFASLASHQQVDENTKCVPIEMLLDPPMRS